MSMIKSSPAFERMMEENRLRDDNSHEEYLDWQYHEKLRKELEAAKGSIAANEIRLGTDLQKKLDDIAKGK